MLIRCVILLYGGEVSEGFGETEDDAFLEAYMDLDQMTGSVYDTLKAEDSPDVVVEYHSE